MNAVVSGSLIWIGFWTALWLVCKFCENIPQFRGRYIGEHLDHYHDDEERWYKEGCP